MRWLSTGPLRLFDQAISAKFSQAERRMQQELAERGKSGEDRQALLDELLASTVWSANPSTLVRRWRP